MVNVFTDDYQEKMRLEEQYSSRNRSFQVPLKQNSLVGDLVKSLIYEYFHNNPSFLCKKIQQFALNALNSNFSLSILRQIIEIIFKQEEKINFYRNYLIQVNRILLDQKQIDQLEKEQIQQDFIFENALNEVPNNHFELLLPTETEIIGSLEEVDQLLSSNICHQNQQNFEVSTIDRIQYNESRIQTSKFNDFFLSTAASQIMSYNLKQQNNISKDSSKQISSFVKKGKNIFIQNNVQKMIEEEKKYDQNRQIKICKSIQGNINTDIIKYNKMIKDTLLRSKLKSRKKGKL